MKKLILFIILYSAFGGLFTPHLFYSQWIQQQIPVNKPITGIKFIDSLKGWACTNSGSQFDTCYILHTTNGGVNWLKQYQLYDSDFLSLNVIDSQYAYSGGYNYQIGGSILYKTTNGGQNWFNQGAPTAPDDLFFINRDSGWYCSSFIGPDVRTTTDGGQTWQLRISGMTASTNRLFFLNYNTGWCGASFWCYKTTNAGVSWVQIGNFINSIASVYFLNESSGWLGFNNRIILHTSNGGVNWIEQENPQFFATINEIVMLSNTLGYAGSRNFRIYKTTNGGSLWGYQADSASSYRITFIDTMKGWSGDFGIAHTTNGGGPIFYVGFVPNGNKVPSLYKLYQNYPNPFNPYTTIKIDISRNSTISLLIYDILGRQRYLVKDQYLNAGTYEFNWDSRNESSGIYFYTLVSDNYRESKKMILVK